MRYRKLAILMAPVLFMSTLTGCSSAPKADMIMHCTYEQTIDAMTYTSTADFTYVKETGQMLSGHITHQYEGYPKDEASNTVLTNMALRASELSETEGVQLELNRTDTGFGSDETWDYTKIDLKEIPYVDEEQANFIDQNRGYYSQDMAKDYYEGQNYGCSVSDIH